MKFFEDFHMTGRFSKAINSTFLVLIPKKERADNIKDFRSISLVGSLYKLLAKVLANHLRKVMHNVISKSQLAFVEGRQIFNAAMIAK